MWAADKHGDQSRKSRSCTLYCKQEAERTAQKWHRAPKGHLTVNIPENSVPDGEPSVQILSQ